MHTYKFYKDGLSWYIDLPEYIQQGGSQGDLQMVDGADVMLDIMSKGSGAAMLQIAVEPFDEADMVALVETCDPIIGGGYYFMESFQGKKVQKRMWLCSVTEFVFGYLPEKIYVKVLSPN